MVSGSFGDCSMISKLVRRFLGTSDQHRGAMMILYFAVFANVCPDSLCVSERRLSRDRRAIYLKASGARKSEYRKPINGPLLR